MKEEEEKQKGRLSLEVTISDEDIYAAMKDIPGYLDVTPADLAEVFRFAYRHAYERIFGAVRAADIMTKSVFCVRKETPLIEVAEIMAEKEISGVPVLDEKGAVAGVISEKDFLARLGSRDRKHVMGIIAQCLKGRSYLAMPIRAKRAEDIMTSPAVTIREDAPIFEIMGLFTARNINRVPVVGKEGALLGIVSRADIIRAPLIKGK
jgi:CBS domain-containing protein